MTLNRIESVAKIFGVFIACIGLFTYCNDKSLARKSESLGYYKRYSETPIAESRIKIANLVYKIDGIKSISNSEYYSTIRTMLNSSHRVHYDTVIDFFEQAHLCIKVGMCDARVLVELLRNEAKKMRLYILPLAEVIREDSQIHADGLYYFAN